MTEWSSPSSGNIEAMRPSDDTDPGTFSKPPNRGAPRLDPLIVEAAREVDHGLLRWMRSLSPRARLRAATKATAALSRIRGGSA